MLLLIIQNWQYLKCQLTADLYCTELLYSCLLPNIGEVLSTNTVNKANVRKWHTERKKPYPIHTTSLHLYEVLRQGKPIDGRKLWKMWLLPRPLRVIGEMIFWGGSNFSCLCMAVHLSNSSNESREIFSHFIVCKFYPRKIYKQYRSLGNVMHI